MARVLKIGTRSSPLAMVQANFAKDLLASQGVEAILVPLTTSGDALVDKCLKDLGGKALFTKELESALLEERIDLAVHSLKDVEHTRPEGLTLACIPARHDPRDVFLGARVQSLQDLPQGSVLGTSSPRRAAQALLMRPDLTIVPFRGNVGTRLEKLESGVAQGTFLAAAGLGRLGVHHPHTQILAPHVMVPAAGQGALAFECRTRDASLIKTLAPFDDPSTRLCVEAERTFLRILGGDCHTPVGVLVHIQGDGAWHAHVFVSVPSPRHVTFEGTKEQVEERLFALAEEARPCRAFS